MVLYFIIHVWCSMNTVYFLVWCTSYTLIIENLHRVEDLATAINVYVHVCVEYYNVMYLHQDVTKNKIIT